MGQGKIGSIEVQDRLSATLENNDDLTVHTSAFYECLIGRMEVQPAHQFLDPQL
jgi:hypothetical protein